MVASGRPNVRAMSRSNITTCSPLPMARPRAGPHVSPHGSDGSSIEPAQSSADTVPSPVGRETRCLTVPKHLFFRCLLRPEHVVEEILRVQDVIRSQRFREHFVVPSLYAEGCISVRVQCYIALCEIVVDK